MENQNQDENFQPSNDLSPVPPISPESPKNLNLPPEKPKMKVWKKILIGIFAAIIFLIVLFYSSPYILGLFFRDISTVADTDLIIIPKNISNSDNAYYDYIKLDGKVFTSANGIKISDFLSGGDWDQNFVDSILSQNQEAITIFDASAAKSNFQNPDFSDPRKINMGDAPPSYMKNIRDISQVISLQSADLSRKGNLDEAINKAFEITGAGQKIENSTCDLICFLTGIAIKDIGIQRLNRILPNVDISSENAAIYNSNLSSYLNNKEPLADAFKVEYMRQTNTISNSMENALQEANLDPAKFKGNFYYQPNRIKELLANDARKYISDLDKSCSDAKSAGETEPPKLSAWKLQFTPNAAGIILNAVLYVPSIGDNMHSKYCDQEEPISNLQNILKKKETIPQ
jgi:hypothetical protein